MGTVYCIDNSITYYTYIGHVGTSHTRWALRRADEINWLAVLYSHRSAGANIDQFDNIIDEDDDKMFNTRRDNKNIGLRNRKLRSVVLLDVPNKKLSIINVSYCV